MLTYQPSTHWSKRRKKKKKEEMNNGKGNGKNKMHKVNEMYQSMCVDQMTLKVKVKQ